MLTLIAAAYDDGYAFVKQDDLTYSFRPPYRRQDKSQVEPQAAERAVTTFGYEATNLPFDNWEGVAAHLSRRAVEARKLRGLGAPDSARIRGLVEKAQPPNVRSYLDRIEQELLPGQEWEAADSLLSALFNNLAILQDRNLLARCSRLADECMKRRPRPQ